MERRKKNFVKLGIIVPLIISVIIAVLFFIVYDIENDNFFIGDGEYDFCTFSSSEVEQMPEYAASSSEIRKAELTLPDKNSVIGNAFIGEHSFEIIFDANSVNSDKRLNLSAGASLIGERGTTFLSCNKKDSAPVRLINTDSVIGIETYYGGYEYRVIDTLLVSSYDELMKCADEYSGALVIYTDANDGYGISDTYYAVICEKISGADINE